MISIDNLVNMVLTEAVEGAPRDHYFDESRIIPYTPLEPRDYSPNNPKYEPRPIRFDLELILYQDGSLRWVE